MMPPFVFDAYKDSDTKDIVLTYINQSPLQMLNCTKDSNNRAICYTIKEHNNIVAFIELSIYTDEKDSVRIELFEVVDKGKGTGSRIIDYIKNNVLNTEITKLCCEPKNCRAASFFVKNGFKNYGDIYCYSP